MIAACALDLAIVVIFIAVATKKKNDPTLLWFGAVIGLVVLLLNIVLYSAGAA